MVASDSFAEFLHEQLAPLGRVALRRMFGKTGVFCNGLMLGMVADDTLYFRVDDQNRAAFEDAGSVPPLNYEKKGRSIDLSFWRAPDRLFDEPDAFVTWARAALAAARRVAGVRERSTFTRKSKRGDGENMKPTSRPNDEAASANITQRIQELGDWRGETLAHVRRLIHDAVPDILEEWKWRGVPVWSHDGIVCTGESYKQVVKLTFAHGATIDDPKALFNASLEGNTRRAIDIREGEKIDEEAFKHLIRAAVARNAAKKRS